MARTALFILLFLGTNASLLLLGSFSAERLLLVLVLFGAGMGVQLYLLFHPRNAWLVDYRDKIEEQRCIALTFDDGPDPVTTPRLLDLLKEKKVPATFFVVGKRAQEHPWVVQRAWREGHLIGNHTWSHSNFFCFLSPARLEREIRQNSELIEQICGVRWRYFRSPIGLRNPWLRGALQTAGLQFISWRVRSCDTIIHDSSVLASRVLRNVRGRDILLFHDRLPSGTDVLMEILPGLIDTLRENGYEFVLAGSRDVAEA